MVKKALTILTSALMILASFAGGVSSFAATPVLAQTSEHTVVVEVDGATGVEYPFAFSVQSGYGQTPSTFQIDFQVISGNVDVVGDITEITLVQDGNFYRGTGHFVFTGSGKMEFTVPNGLVYSTVSDLRDGDTIPYSPTPFKVASDSTDTSPIFTRPNFIAYYAGMSLRDTDPETITHHWEVDDFSTASPHALTWNFQNNSAASFDAATDFTSVEVDGVELNSTDYETSQSRGFDVSIKSDTLSTLSTGSHTATFRFGARSAMGSFNILSAPAPVAFTQYTPVAGDNDIPLNKYLVLAEDAQVPNATFSFAVSNGTAISYSNGIMEVLAPTAANGVGGSAPTIASISYTASDTASMTDAADAGVTLSSGQKYVKKTTYVDFSATTFAEPGIFRYVITESGNNEAIFDMDAQRSQSATQKVRYLDVYVVDSNDGTNTLSISEYVLHELADNVPTGSNNGTGYASLPIADKSVGYVNIFLSQNLGVANKTDGNQGSRDKYFAYTVALTGLQGEKAYDVDISNADAEVASTVATAQGYRGNSNPTTLTSLANGSASGTFYLRDDQNIEIKGLPVGVGYTVTAVAEDYKQTAGATITAGTFTDSATGTIASADIATGYTHTRNGVIPTGIAVSAAGTIAIAGFAVAGLLAKRKREDEE